MWLIRILLQMQSSTICNLQLVYFSSKNKMDIEALLNPHEESQMMDGVRDEEICQAMLAMRKTHYLCPALHAMKCFGQHPSSTGMLNISTIPLHASLKQFWPLSDVKCIWRNPGQCPPPDSLIILLDNISFTPPYIPNAQDIQYEFFENFNWIFRLIFSNILKTHTLS